MVKPMGIVLVIGGVLLSQAGLPVRGSYSGLRARAA